MSLTGVAEGRPPDVVTNVGGPVKNEFEITVPDDPFGNWLAMNDLIAASVLPTQETSEVERQSKKMVGGQPAHIWKSNAIKKAGTPFAYKEQWLIMELDGVFAHLQHLNDGTVRIIMANKRLV
jgi:hypothetical protein